MHPRAAPALFTLAFLYVALPALPQSTGLTIDKAYTLTRAASEAIRLRKLSLEKTRLAVEEAASRALPRVDLQASASYLAHPPQGYKITRGMLATSPIIIPPNDVTIGAQLHNYFSVAASLSQPLFTWGKIRNAIDLAGLLVDAAVTDLAAQQRDIDREVHRTFFGALLTRDSESVLRRLRDAAAAIAADRQKSLDQGTINREAVLEAQSNLASIEAKLVESVQAQATALEGLGMLTGLDPSGIELATGFRSALPALDEQAVRSRAEASAIEMAAARTRVSQARKKLAIEKGGSMLLPDVSLGVSLGVTDQQDFPYAAWNWNNSTLDWGLVISIGVKMSMFDGLAALKRIGQAEKDVEMAATGLSQQGKLLRLDVRKAIDAAVKADADVMEKQAAADYAGERLRNATVSFDNGLASREEMHGADILAGSAELDLLLSLYTREEALADIARITGERI
jgi:outer membrane protein TolC